MQRHRLNREVVLKTAASVSQFSIQKLSPFQSQGHLTGWVVEDELLEEADQEGLQQLT